MITITIIDTTYPDTMIAYETIIQITNLEVRHELFGELNGIISGSVDIHTQRERSSGFNF